MVGADHLTLFEFLASEIKGHDPENWDMTLFSGKGIVSRQFSGHVPISPSSFTKSIRQSAPHIFCHVIYCVRISFNSLYYIRITPSRWISFPQVCLPHSWPEG